MNENDLKWVTNEKKILLLLKQFNKKNRSKDNTCRKLGHSLEIQNGDLMHREDLKGSKDLNFSTENERKLR